MKLNWTTLSGVHIMHPAGELVHKNLFPNVYGVDVGSLEPTISLHVSAAAELLLHRRSPCATTKSNPQAEVNF